MQLGPHARVNDGDGGRNWPNENLPMSKRSDRLTRRDLGICLLIGVLSFLVYNANGRAIPAVDTYIARYLPLSIIPNGQVVVDPISEVAAQGRKLEYAREDPDAAFWVRKGLNGHLVSFYPIVVPVIVAPLYLPAVAYLDRAGWEPGRVDMVARLMEKLSASLLASLTVTLVYLLLRRRADKSVAIGLAAVFAFGTTNWVVSSQALWMHGLGGLLVAATLFLLTGRATKPRAAAAGFVCALIACNRQPDIILAAALWLYGLWWSGRKQAIFFLVAGAVPAGLVLAYNLAVVGNAFGAYAQVSQAGLDRFLVDRPVEGFLGLLFSPTHGLFVFSPFLLVLLLCLPVLFRAPRWRVLTAMLGCAVVVQMAGYSFGDWRQGGSFGPRWLTDMLPLLFWMLPPVVMTLPRIGRGLFVLACAVAVAIQLIGAFWYTGSSDIAIHADDGGRPMNAAWQIRNAPFIAELNHPPAPRDLLIKVRGSIDVAKAFIDENGAALVEIAGWSLADVDTPADIALRVDGQTVAGTSSFLVRKDVVAALGETGASGWHFVLPADELSPGAHKVSVLVRPLPGSEPRLMAERGFTVDTPEKAAARRAVDLIAAGQQAPGYWLTPFTSGTRFEKPNAEMNTFTQALLIDMLTPVAERAGLTNAVSRARAFLNSQIEHPTGLVRYHGRTDAPTIGILGCAITPDSDDTALAWRVAPSENREDLQSALNFMKRFRTESGLYRTWLAPRDQYECLDPGHDPNPTDLGIQINILMLLATADPPAAHALCEALRRQVDDNAVWVYYDRAPLIVALRRTDLERLNCSLEIPQHRMAATEPGQGLWMEVTSLVQGLESGVGDRRRGEELLHNISTGDFALLKQFPPLIYNNDLTGTVRRHYWSPELGLTLWLRLYFATVGDDGRACGLDSNCG